MKLKILSTVALAALVSACGSDGAPGADGPQGPEGAAPGEPAGVDSSLSLVTPNKGVLDREVEVSIGGSATRFEEGVKPDFGDGIEVLDVVYSTPTLVTARLRISKDAAVGPRRVTIGGLVAENAFRVSPAINVTSPRPGEQGGLAMVELENVDVTAFDSGAFQVGGGGLVPYFSQVQGPFAGVAFMLVPPMAPAGAMGVEAQNLDSKGEARITFLSAPDAFQVTQRAAAALEYGKARTAETLADDLSSKLYKVATPADQDGIVSVRIHVPEGEKTILSTALWGAGGKADDLVSRFDAVEDGFFGPQPKEAPYDLVYSIPVSKGAASSYFVTVLDYAGTSDAKFDVLSSSVTATVHMETLSSHDTRETAEPMTLAGSLAGTLVKGQLSEDGEMDWYKFNVAAGEKIQIGVNGVEGQAGVNDGSNFVAVTSGGPKLFATTAESPPLAAGERFVAVVGKKGSYTLTLRRLAP
jgi:hypothetical protein